MENNIIVKHPQSPSDFQDAKALILEYVNWLGVHGGPKVKALLDSQNFDKELDTLSTTYSAPDGGLTLALHNNKPVGVAGIKKFSEDICEVKRMFVLPECRGMGVGKLLLAECIEIAKDLHYETIKLDTANFMNSAIKLYIDKGFFEIPPYRENLHEDAKYFELHLKK